MARSQVGEKEREQIRRGGQGPDCAKPSKCSGLSLAVQAVE